MLKFHIVRHVLFSDWCMYDCHSKEGYANLLQRYHAKKLSTFYTIRKGTEQ